MYFLMFAFYNLNSQGDYFKSIHWCLSFVLMTTMGFQKIVESFLNKY